MVKHPCIGCVYFESCGERTRTMPCEGRVTKREFHCGAEESGGPYNCNNCPNKCEEWYQWNKEMKEDGNVDC